MSSLQVQSASAQEPSLESYVPSGLKLPPPHGIAMQTLPLHVGVRESVQFADEEYVATTAAVATMVFPVKRMVKDIAAGSSSGAVDTHVCSAVSVHVDVVVHAAGVGREILVLVIEPPLKLHTGHKRYGGDARHDTSHSADLRKIFLAASNLNRPPSITPSGTAEVKTTG